MKLFSAQFEILLFSLISELLLQKINLSASTINNTDDLNYDETINNGNHTHEFTPLQLQWNSYLSIASMIPTVLFLFVNVFEILIADARDIIGTNH